MVYIEIYKNFLEVYGLAGLCLVYLLKKDWKSFEILKKITDNYTQKLREIENKNNETCNFLFSENKIIKDKLEKLEKQNNDLRKKIKIINTNRRQK